MSQKPIAVVTGGAGFVGTHLTRALLDEGFAVHAVDALISPVAGRVLDADIVLHKIDVCDRAALEKLFNELGAIDAVFHLAAIPSVQYSLEHPQESHRVNVDGTLAALLAAKTAGVKKFIYSASSAAYGDQKTLPHREDMLPMPQSPYALQKYVGEHYVRIFSEAYGLPSVSLRYFNIYGPGANPTGAYASALGKFIQQRKDGTALTITGDGLQTRDMVHVRDVARANIMAYKSGKTGKGEVINIGSGRATAVLELASLVGGSITHVPPRIELRHSCADISRAKELLGWEPTIYLKDGVEELKRLAGIV